MQKKKIGLIISVFVLLGLGFICYNLYENKSEKQEAIEQFTRSVERINTSFVYEGYEEIMKNESHVLAPPKESERLSNPSDVVNFQKQFVYMNQDGEGLVMLQITLNENMKSGWNSSMSYRPILYNHEESKYGNICNTNIPEVDVSANSFSYGGCNYNLICIASGSEGYEIGAASTLLTDFSNKLIPFILEE